MNVVVQFPSPCLQTMYITNFYFMLTDAPPLWCAAAAGHYDIVKCLIEHKADPNCRTLTNSTPLRAACFDGHLKIVKYLLSHNADLEIANRYVSIMIL